MLILMKKKKNSLVKLEYNEFFDILEFGLNCIELLLQIKDGCIFCKHPEDLAYFDEPECNIEYQGIRFIDFYKFLDYCAE